MFCTEVSYLDWSPKLIKFVKVHTFITSCLNKISKWCPSQSLEISSIWSFNWIVPLHLSLLFHFSRLCSMLSVLQQNASLVQYISICSLLPWLTSFFLCHTSAAYALSSLSVTITTSDLPRTYCTNHHCQVTMVSKLKASPMLHVTV